MSAFTKAIKKVAQGGADAFKTFPASIASALAFAIVSAVKIGLGWQAQEPYNFLLNCMQWSLALGSVFGLTAITWARSRYNDKSKLMLANIVTASVVLISFLSLYFLGGYRFISTDKYLNLRGIYILRMTVAMFVSIIAFIVFAGLPRKKSDFSASLFMTQKAFFVAVVYGAVLMGGLSSVAGAFQGLLYNGMSPNVYQYLGTIVGFLAFAVFVGYFPDFSKEEPDEKRISEQTQPKFVETIFSYIMVPIVLALTVVLLIWTARTLFFEGIGANFERLSGIAISYAIVGIWLHIMVSDHKTGTAKLYRKVYPFTALIILGFELWALIVQLARFGMKTEEYFFILIWIASVIAVILLIFKKNRAHVMIASIVCVLGVVSVLPLVGYHRLPPTMQVKRLEKLLTEQGMLEEGSIKPAETEPQQEVKENITDAVDYLVRQRDTSFPDWLDSELVKSDVFEKTFGFEQEWPEYEQEYPGPGEYSGISLALEPSALDISNYDWAVNMQDFMRNEDSEAEIEGTRGKYKVYWSTDQGRRGVPELSIYLDDRLIIQESMDEYLDKISDKYMSENRGYAEAGVEDLSLVIESPEIEVFLVFSNLEINRDPRSGEVYSWIQLNNIYIDEK